MKNFNFELKKLEYGITPLPENPEVAMAYIPFQNSTDIYSLEKGIIAGTLFPVLDKPFFGKGVSK